MKKRIKKKDTLLFFDSFKHLKNNISNLIFFELVTLVQSEDVKSYLDLKPVNVKSKYPDMRKLGLIDYNNPKDNAFELTQIGEEIYNIFKDKGNNYFKDSDKRLKSIDPSKIYDLLDKTQSEKLKRDVTELLISYYDSADSIRPYLALLKFIEANNITTLDNKVLNDILAHPKDKILSKKYIKGLFDKLDDNSKLELVRPISYMINSLETAGIINKKREIIYDRELVKEVIYHLDEIYVNFEEYNKKDVKGRSTKEQSEFRDKVLEAYGYKCAITNKCIKINSRNGVQYLLDAAHIISYSEAGSFSVNNGIALSYELHKLFDKDLFTFIYNENNELEVLVTDSKGVEDDGILSEINHKVVRLPNDKDKYPDEIALKYRLEHHLLS